jgi:hypothetical protein
MANADPNLHTDEHGYENGNCNIDAFEHTNEDNHPDQHIHAAADRHIDLYPNEHSHADSYRDKYADKDEHGHADCDSNPDTFEHSNRNVHPE